jgi:hypothetical protein
MKGVICSICNVKVSHETHCADCEIDTCWDCALNVDCTDPEDLFDIDGDVVMIMAGC